jgi:hypothetical protein
MTAPVIAELSKSPLSSKLTRLLLTSSSDEAASAAALVACAGCADSEADGPDVGTSLPSPLQATRP